MSTISYFVHMDPTIFPDPESFDPERWMHVDKQTPLTKFLVPFTRGSRACVGMK